MKSLRFTIFGIMLCTFACALITNALLYVPIYFNGINHGGTLRNAALAAGVFNGVAGVIVLAKLVSGKKPLSAPLTTS